MYFYEYSSRAEIPLLLCRESEVGNAAIPIQLATRSGKSQPTLTLLSPSSSPLHSSPQKSKHNITLSTLDSTVTVVKLYCLSPMTLPLCIPLSVPFVSPSLRCGVESQTHRHGLSSLGLDSTLGTKDATSSVRRSGSFFLTAVYRRTAPAPYSSVW